MAKELVTDELREIVDVLLPPEPSKSKGGKPRVPDRPTLTSVASVPKKSIPWYMLPNEMGCGSAPICWRRLQDWERAGTWRDLHRILLDLLGETDQIDWSRASLDLARVPAKGERDGRQEPDGSQHTALKAPRCSGPEGCPPCGSATGGQRTRLEGLRGSDGRYRTKRVPGTGPRWQPEKPCANKGYDFGRCCKALRKRNIMACIARRDKDASERLGGHRWMVAHTHAWLARYRGLAVHYKLRVDIHEAFLHLACSLIFLTYLS